MYEGCRLIWCNANPGPYGRGEGGIYVRVYQEHLLTKRGNKSAVLTPICAISSSVISVLCTAGLITDLWEKSDVVLCFIKVYCILGFRDSSRYKDSFIVILLQYSFIVILLQYSSNICLFILLQFSSNIFIFILL